jgi:hypothetical protein
MVQHLGNEKIMTNLTERSGSAPTVLNFGFMNKYILSIYIKLINFYE